MTTTPNPFAPLDEAAAEAAATAKTPRELRRAEALARRAAEARTADPFAGLPS